jgi:hypothetical protein
VLLAASCTVADRLAERGIGGTGAPITSAAGDTGVLGTITGFGSVFVNGLEIGTDRLGSVLIDGEARPLGDLRVGQVSKIVAGGSGRLEASAVEVVHEVSGPVESSAPGKLVVAGQRVSLTAHTIGAVPRAGAWVAVSGLRDADGAIVATRLDQRAPGEASLSGMLAGSGPDLRIGELPVRIQGAGVASGARVTLTGSLVDGVLIARSSVPAAADAFPAAVGRVVIEGYVRGADGRLSVAGSLTVAAGVGVALPAQSRLAVVEMRRDPMGSLVATELRGAPRLGRANGAGFAPGRGPASGMAAPGGPMPGRQPAPGAPVVGGNAPGPFGGSPSAGPQPVGPIGGAPMGGGPMGGGPMGGGPMGGGPVGGGPMGGGPVGGGPMGGRR